jgi:hypothetical protein
MKRCNTFDAGFSCCALMIWAQSVWAFNSITVSLVKPDPNLTVASGVPFELRVVANITEDRLSAVAYTLGATTDSNDARAYLIRRSGDPDDPNTGLTYISETLQMPFENNLAHNFTAGPQTEVITDMDFGGVPGSPNDGLEHNTNVVLEWVRIVPTGTGDLTITLSNLSAVTTQYDPNGALYDTMVIESNQVNLTVGGDAYHWLTTRVDPEGGGGIDLNPPLSDPCLPVYASGTDVVLDANKTGPKPFKYWRIFDPNYPGDANHAVQDSNDPTTITMDSDQEVEAYFHCGPGLLPLAAVGLIMLSGLWLVRRRRS